MSVGPYAEGVHPTDTPATPAGLSGPPRSTASAEGLDKPVPPCLHSSHQHTERNHT
nr:MAG TPA: hypothetical protein [Caudoviricetes sp.]